MLVYGYVRVSTVEQERGFGLEAQQSAILEYCKKEDLPDPEIITEQGSGESLFKRIQLMQLLSKAEDLVESGERVIIIFYRLDRLSRNQIELEATIIKSFKTGVEFRSTDMVEADLLSPEYQKDPMRVAMRQIIGVFAQLERATIQARLEGGLAMKASKGGFTGGRLPRGYKSEEQALVIDPDVAPIIRRIFHLKKSHLANTTILAICARDYPQCQGWHKSYITAILKREDLYCRGEYRPRGGSVTFTLPDLVIVQGEIDPAEEVEPGAVNWDKVTDPIRLDALAYLIDTDEAQLKALILEHSLPVKWRGNKTNVPKETAQQLAGLAK